MIEAFKQFVEQKQLCFPGNKILVAVSGGIDSVVLLDLFYKTNYHIAIAHCNFSLRGDESNQDEDFVKGLSDKYRVEFFVKKFNTKKISEKTGLSIQETARNLRYDWFNELAENYNFNHIAVAHHFGDQAETFFINLFRGSGVSGLKGMPLKRDKIIRPLLFARRAEIEQYAHKNKLNFREDSSNSSDKYLRNRIRHNILPEIEKAANNFPLAMADSLRFLSEDEAMLKQLVQKKKESVFLCKNKQIIIPQEGIFCFDAPDVWLFYMLKGFSFNRDVTDEIMLALLEGKIGKIFFSESHQLLVDRGQLIVREKENKMNHNRKWHLRKSSITVPIHLTPRVFNNQDALNLKAGPTLAYFDFEKLKFPLLIRHWREGDLFVPFGMKGSKLVSDFLIDQKVNLFEKENIFVMLSGKEIIWVIGMRASENFKVTEQTKKIYQVELGNDAQPAE